MSKKKLLIAYYQMIVGGSTTSLLALLNSLDKSKYEIDLQLYHNRGPMLADIPEGVNLLPPAVKYDNRVGHLIKRAAFVLSGGMLRARLAAKKAGRSGHSGQMLVDFQTKHFSKKNKKHYDVAIGFLEGWPVRYVAYHVKADKKLGWLHSTFANIAAIPDLEKNWMDKVDNVVFVADNCRDAFREAMPDMAEKAVTVRNITDSSLVRKRAEQCDEQDADFVRFRDADCFKIVTVCRVTISVKGLDRAVACAKRLKECGKRFLWMILGDGADLERLREMIAQAGVSDCMVAVGNRMNPFPFVKQADVFCMPSRYEGKPMVITESMILGVPPFVTRYLSAEEQIQNGVEGVIAENEDDTIFEALREYMERPEALENMKAYLVAHDYGNSEYAREIENKYLT